MVFADYYRIYQVIKNLVTNSIKYSDSDSQVLVECEKRKKIARIIIKDKGKGIPKNDRKRIFERFNSAIVRWVVSTVMLFIIFEEFTSRIIQPSQITANICYK